MSIWECLEINRQTQCVSCFNDLGFWLLRNNLLKKRATYGRNINAYERKINLQAEMIDTWEIVFDYYETIIRENMQHIIKYKCIWHRITSSNRDNTRKIKYISKKSFDWNFLLHTTLITFITSLKKFNMLSKKCWSSSDISYICKFVTKQFLRDHATYYRNKLCQYGNILRSSDKLHVYLVLMILVFGYYETIILKTRNLWSEYKCILPKNIS